tara:strand:- start:727 stop:924 length:198 start_codon:yes stop_codon:yes gene_type:complete
MEVMVLTAACCKLSTQMEAMIVHVTATAMAVNVGHHQTHVKATTVVMAKGWDAMLLVPVHIMSKK